MQVKVLYYLLIPLALSAFTHLWNPIGFPDLFSDEGVYIRRGLHLLAGLGPQERDAYYATPFFGQIFLAGIFKIINYPAWLGHSINLSTLEMLFAVPRILMGIMAVLDTLLVYKISEILYKRNVATVASALFAVMPMSWFIRRVLLEAIQLPFLLSSILCALYIGKVMNPKIKQNRNAKHIALVLASGVLLGLSIFTKIPIFVMIPLTGYLIFTNSNRSWRNLGLWFIPVLLIPAIWPIFSFVNGQFGYWVDAVRMQTVREGVPLISTVFYLLQTDPVLIFLGAIGIIFAILRKDLFILLWIIPFFIFLLIIASEWSPYQLFIPIVPVLCIATAKLIFDATSVLKLENRRQMISWGLAITVVTFGLVSTSMLITTNITSGQFQIVNFALLYLNNNVNENESVMIVSNPIYSWIFKYVYDIGNVLNEVNDFDYEPVKTEMILFIWDIESKDLSPYSERLPTLYNTTTQLFKVNGLGNNFDTTKYPFTSMTLNYESMNGTEVRVCKDRCVKYD